MNRLEAHRRNLERHTGQLAEHQQRKAGQLPSGPTNEPTPAALPPEPKREPAPQRPINGPEASEGARADLVAAFYERNRGRPRRCEGAGTSSFAGLWPED